MEKKQSVIGIGEALFDVLPEGKKLGVAPANFAYHVSQFGLNSCAVSAIGDDELGKELENELGITIFKRTNKGILLSAEGEEFLGYARQVIEQTNLIEERYLGKTPVKHQFCVSTQHYSFAVEAFVELLKQYGGEEYDFRIRETQTYELIEDVAKLRSEVGVLYLNSFNEAVLRKTMRKMI